MGLWSALGVGKSALTASQLALEVSGHNIANAAAPGYARQRAVLGANPARDAGQGLIVGTGVSVQSIQAMVDRYLDQGLQAARSEVADLSTRLTYFSRIEGIVNELGADDFSTALNEFFSAIEDLQPDPANAALRRVFVQRAMNLAGAFTRTRARLDSTRLEADQRVAADAAEVNRLTASVAALNRRIVAQESASGGTANDLRSQRTLRLEELSRLIQVRTVETGQGEVNVFTGNETLVQSARSVDLRVEVRGDRGVQQSHVVFADDGRAVPILGGELAGLIASRDEILGGVVDDLDQLAAAVIREVNRVHASGQGLSPFGAVVSRESVTDPAAALDEAGLPFTPNHGRFDITIFERDTGIGRTYSIPVDLDGLEQDGTLADVAASLDLLDGIHASVNSHNRLVIEADSDRLAFTFGNDTSGLLAALGINTLFAGHDSRTIGLAAGIEEDVSLVAAATTGQAGDGSNLTALLRLRTKILGDLDGLTMSDFIQTTATTWASQTAATREASSAAGIVAGALQAEREALSGVSVDEETMDLIRFSRTFQAAARFVATVDELMRMLLTL